MAQKLEELFFRRNDTNLGVTCADVNCGEAGCTYAKGKPICLCPGKPPTPPDKLFKCTPIIGNHIGTGIPHFLNTPLPDDAGVFDGVIRNDTARSKFVVGKPMENKTDLDVRVMQIVFPVIAGVFIILALIIIYMLRRRREHFRNMRQVPLGWLQRQESATLLDQMTVLSKNPNYYTPDLDTNFLLNLQDKRIPTEKFCLLEEIGEGAFGKVFKGQVMWSSDNEINVAVKILKKEATREAREDFKREVEIMSSFYHENILKLVGIVAGDEDSPYMVFEFMEYGDLAHLLRKNDPQLAKPRDVKLKQTDLVDIASQIANGMEYLASQHFIHRDLATRNCLVGSNLILKISDFGMSRDIYTCDYYKIGGARMLPVRWMSPESIKYGKFTTESDVWAYGIVLWEIFTYGKQPYYGHSNEEVIHYIDDGVLLQKPDKCPDTIYHVMLGCWRRCSKDRFNFEKVHRHLVDYQRKMTECAHFVESRDETNFTLV